MSTHNSNSLFGYSPTKTVLIVLLFNFIVFPSADSVIVKLPQGTSIVFIHIPAGSFTMGSNEAQGSNWNTCDWNPSCDKPQHTVSFKYSFYIGKFEVTNSQWHAIMDTTPSFNSKCPECPVEKVNWYDCHNFINKINTLGIGSFRLPSEAEWEYACRAGTTTRFNFGNPECEADAENCTELNNFALWGGNAKGRTEPVGMRAPNNWGLYDMLGNVYEWCEDDWHKSYTNAPVDGSAWKNNSSVSSPLKCLRGAWRGYDAVKYYRSAFRANHEAEMRHDCCGLRLVKENIIKN